MKDLVAAGPCRRAVSIAGIVSIAVLAILTISSPLAADTIWTMDGRKIVGKVLEQQPKRVLVEFRKGGMSAKMWIDRKDIFDIEIGLTPEEEFHERLSKLSKVDLDGHVALLEWAKKKRLLKLVPIIEKRLPSIRYARLKLDHPRTWCRNCDGVGKVICKTCEGTGKELITCERCEGTGEVECRTCRRRDDALLRCRRCGGQGSFERFDPKLGKKKKVKCEDCKGTGLHPCPTCNGTKKQPCPTCKGEKGEHRTCSACHDNPESPCTVCGGRGLQPNPVDDATLAREAEAIAESLAKQRARAEADLAVLKAAAESFQSDYTRWPESVGELRQPPKRDGVVKAYLDHTPKDPWTGEPYKLERDAKTLKIISFGSDQAAGGEGSAADIIVELKGS